MAKMVNVGKNITAEQTVMCATLILERFSDLRPDDMKLFTKKFICGEYGKIYDKLDVQTIIEAFSIYENERHNAIIEANIKKNEAEKLENKEIKLNGIPPDKAERLKELIDGFGKPKEKHPDFGKRPVLPPPNYYK